MNPTNPSEAPQQVNNPVQPTQAVQPAQPAVNAPVYAAPTGMGAPAAQNSGSKKTLIITAVVLLLVAAVAASAFIALGGKNKNQTVQNQSVASTNQSSRNVTGEANDAKIQADVRALQTNLEAFYNSAVYYPSLTQLNDPAFQKAKLPSLDPSALPSGGFIAGAPTNNTFSYTTSPTNCDNKSEATQCQSYKLSGALSTGTYSKTSL